MINIFKLQDDTEYDFKRDAFALALIAVLFLSSTFSLYYTFFPSTQKIIYLSLINTFILSGIISLIYLKTKRYKLLSVILLVYVLCLFLPSYLVHGFHVRSATPIWFAVSAIAVFFMVDTKRFWWICPCIIYWDTYIFVKYYIWEETKTADEKPVQFFIIILVSFILVSVSLILIIVLQERNLSREQLARDEAREKIRQVGLAKSRFLANMSHEIRTPMNSIIGLSELILKDDMSEATRLEVSLIRDSAFDLLDIIDNVLTYAKLDAGKVELTPSEFDFAELIGNIIDTFSINVFEKELQFHINIDHTIPKTVYGDKVKIRQVITTLLFISLSLTDNGRIKIELNSEKDPITGKEKFTGCVSDTGIGLSKADLNAIYGAYGSYDSKQNSNLKGISLKFSICKELLSLMNGNLEISSIEDIGLESKFTFECDVVDSTSMVKLDDRISRKVLIYIGLARAMSIWKPIMEGFSVRPDYVTSYFAFEKAIQNKQYDFIFLSKTIYPSVSNIISQYHTEKNTYVMCTNKDAYGDFDKCRIIRHPLNCINVGEILNNEWREDKYTIKHEDVVYDGSRAKVLVVDDNSVNLKVAAGIFKNYKINIDIAKSGDECLKKMKTTNYHLVLMDMIMPEMSGPETLTAIRESLDESINKVPVVALTATTGSNVRQEILDQGFQEYISKPIKPRYLIPVLETFLPPNVFKIKKAEPTKVEKKEDDLCALENVLDVSKGLANIGYNESSYIAILNTYYSEGMRKLELLPNLLEVGDIDLFTTDVHGIKSSSASIGAMTVSQMFKELEFAGKDKNLDKINKYFISYTEAFKKILEDVKEYLESKNMFEYKDENDKGDLSLIEEEHITKEILEELKTNIDKMNLKECDRILDNLTSRNFGAEMNNNISDIKKAYDMFDFHSVKGTLADILTSV